MKSSIWVLLSLTAGLLSYNSPLAIANDQVDFHSLHAPGFKETTVKVMDLQFNPVEVLPWGGTLLNIHLDYELPGFLRSRTLQEDFTGIFLEGDIEGTTTLTYLAELDSSVFGASTMNDLQNKRRLISIGMLDADGYLHLNEGLVFEAKRIQTRAPWLLKFIVGGPVRNSDFIQLNIRESQGF